MRRYNDENYLCRLSVGCRLRVLAFARDARIRAGRLTLKGDGKRALGQVLDGARDAVGCLQG